MYVPTATPVVTNASSFGGGSVFLTPDWGAPPVPFPSLSTTVARLAQVGLKQAPSYAVHQWVFDNAPALTTTDRDLLLLYTSVCEAWAERVRNVLEHRGDRRDFTTNSAHNRTRNQYEVRLGELFAAAGLVLEPEVGVSKDGGSRRGGWYGSFWLDWAYRNAADALLLDVEMDGRYHAGDERAQRDQHRNQQLLRRGWYVLRVPSTVLREPRVSERIVAHTLEQLRWHRRAHALARIGTRTLTSAFAAYDATLIPGSQAIPTPVRQSLPQTEHQPAPTGDGRGAAPLPRHTAPSGHGPQEQSHPVLRTLGYLWAGLSVLAGLGGDRAAFWSGLIFLFIMLAATDAWSMRRHVPLLGSAKRGDRVLGYTLLVVLYFVVLIVLSPQHHSP